MIRAADVSESCGGSRLSEAPLDKSLILPRVQDYDADSFEILHISGHHHRFMRQRAVAASSESIAGKGRPRPARSTRSSAHRIETERSIDRIRPANHSSRVITLANCKGLGVVSNQRRAPASGSPPGRLYSDRPFVSFVSIRKPPENRQKTARKPPENRQKTAHRISIARGEPRDLSKSRPAPAKGECKRRSERSANLSAGFATGLASRTAGSGSNARRA